MCPGKRAGCCGALDHRPVLASGRERGLSSRRLIASGVGLALPKPRHSRSAAVPPLSVFCPVLYYGAVRNCQHYQILASGFVAAGVFRKRDYSPLGST